MVIINRKTISVSIAAILMITLTLPLAYSVAQGQTSTTFTPTDKFSIPALNSTISFDPGGSYEKASLQNNTWIFENIQLGNTKPPENLTVSAQDSNVTMQTYQVYNSTTVTIRLRYTVVGHGTQTFNFGFIKGGSRMPVLLLVPLLAQKAWWW